jgi:DHA2 family multidrug resistance protein
MTTYISSRTKFHFDTLKDYVSPNDVITQQRLESFKALFMSKGFSAYEATQQAIFSLQGQVTRQALMLTYRDAFLIVGGFFLVCIPLLLLFKRQKKDGAQHIEMAME